MIVHAVFVWPEGYEGPELAVAWDEFCVDGNREGWVRARRAAIEEYGPLSPAMVRDVELSVDYDVIRNVFLPVEITIEARHER